MVISSGAVAGRLVSSCPVPSSSSAMLNLETDLDKFSNGTDVILINSGNSPTPMYFAHRKGWIDSNSKISDEEYINKLKKVGLKYIVILKRTFGENINLNLYRHRPAMEMMVFVVWFAPSPISDLMEKDAIFGVFHYCHILFLAFYS